MDPSHGLGSTIDAPCWLRVGQYRFGSIQIPSEDHELRVRELQRLAQRKVNDEPGPFESNVYTPSMQQSGSRYKRYVPQGRKQQYVSVDDQQTHLVEVETHVFREVSAGERVKIGVKPEETVVTRALPSRQGRKYIPRRSERGLCR